MAKHQLRKAFRDEKMCFNVHIIYYIYRILAYKHINAACVRSKTSAASTHSSTEGGSVQSWFTKKHRRRRRRR